MKLARQHLRILRHCGSGGDELFDPLTRREMTRYNREAQQAKREWNDKKARGLCMEPFHYEFGVAPGDKCEKCGKVKGV